jgi:hypothetical protein
LPIRGVPVPRVLDIDRDIFVNPICHVHSDRRLSNEYCEVWRQQDVRRFLEDVCSLRRSDPTPGVVLEEHDDLFDRIARAVDRGTLQAPFDLVHVDAHADMGAGQIHPIRYVLTELMHEPIDLRANPARGEAGLNRGTVLLFIGARGWLQSLTYVHHPDGGQDLPQVFLDFEIASEKFYFRLPRCDPSRFEAWARSFGTAEQLWEACGDEAEIKVPFALVPMFDLKPSQYDFVSVTRSPGFTPPKADSLFELIAQYIAPTL